MDCFPVCSCGSSGAAMLQPGMPSQGLPWAWGEVVPPGSAAGEAALAAALAAWRMGQEEGMTVPLWRGRSDSWDSLLLPLHLPGLVFFAFLKEGCLASIQPSLLGAVVLAPACTTKGHIHGWGTRLGCADRFKCFGGHGSGIWPFLFIQLLGTVKIQAWEKGNKNVILHFLFGSNETPTCSTEFVMNKALRNKTLIVSLSLRIPKPQIPRTAFLDKCIGRTLFWYRKEKGRGYARIAGCQCCPSCMVFIINLKYGQRYPNGIVPISSWMQHIL